MKNEMRKYNGVWKHFISMLYKAKLPYLWLAIALVLGIASNSASLAWPDYIATIVDGNYEMKFVLSLIELVFVWFITTLASNYVKKLTQAIRKEKIKLAMEMLRFSNRSILEISDYLGFHSQSYFGKVFKEETGMSPEAYRQQNRSSEF